MYWDDQLHVHKKLIIVELRKTKNMKNNVYMDTVNSALYLKQKYIIQMQIYTSCTHV